MVASVVTTKLYGFRSALKKMSRCMGRGAPRTIAVPADDHLKAAQIAHIPRDSGEQVLVTTARPASDLHTELANLANVSIAVTVDEHAWGCTSDRAKNRWSEQLTAERHPRRSVMCSDVAANFHTSGRLSEAQIVLLSHNESTHSSTLFS